MKINLQKTMNEGKMKECLNICRLLWTHYGRTRLLDSHELSDFPEFLPL